MQCVNKNLREYQTLKKQSGLPDFVLSAYVGDFLDKYNRFPYLDELPNSNSSKAISEELSLNKDSVTKTENILQATNTNHVDEAVQVLNNKYRDKEIEVLEIGNTSKVYITERPTINPKNINDPVDIKEVNSFHYFNDIIDKLETLYGINVIPITNAELNSAQWKDIIGVDGVKAFVYNGDIYLNTDIATVDSPVHEFLHLLLGGIKYSNRGLYEQLINSSEQFETYQEISENYPNRTRGDVNEEVFVTEIAKYLTGQTNAIDNLEGAVKYEIFYNINRTLDSMLMGDISVKSVKNPYDLTLKTLAQIVNSQSMVNNFRGSMNDATLNRIMANTKSELMKNGDLREDCK